MSAARFSRNGDPPLAAVPAPMAARSISPLRRARAAAVADYLHRHGGREYHRLAFELDVDEDGDWTREALDLALDDAATLELGIELEGDDGAVQIHVVVDDDTLPEAAA